MKSPTPVLVIGASGHALVVIDILRSARDFCVKAIFDDDPRRARTRVAGIPVLGPSSGVPAAARRLKAKAVVAVGDNRARLRISASLTRAGVGRVSAVHPSAVVAHGVPLRAGTVVMAGAVINPGTSVGEDVILNTSCTVDHECVLGDGSHVSPGANLAGGVVVGRAAHVGIGAAVLPGVRIGAGAVLGGGGVAVRDIPDGQVWAGIPARRLRGRI